MLSPKVTMMGPNAVGSFSRAAGGPGGLLGAAGVHGGVGRPAGAVGGSAGGLRNVSWAVGSFFPGS